MFSTAAMAQTTTAPGGPGGSPMDLIVQFLPFILLFVLFYFLMIRPQQRKAKLHAAMIAGVKRGDTVVMNNGMIGKVSRVEDAEVSVEIAPNVQVKVVKAMLSDVRARGEPMARAASSASPRTGSPGGTDRSEHRGRPGGAAS